MSPELMIALGMFASLVVGLFMGFPIAFVLNGIALIFGVAFWGTNVIDLFIQKIYGTMANNVLMAIPLFIFMANILEKSRLSDKIFESARELAGPLKGGVAIAVVVVSTLLAACTGIIGASVVAAGLIALPIMNRYHYNKPLSTGVVGAAGSLGILIPPSIMLIVMAANSSCSVGGLFAGAVFPGLILSSLYIIYILVICAIHPDYAPAMPLEERLNMPIKERWITFAKGAVPSLVLIFGVLGSIFSGIATPTEAAGVGAFLMLILTMVYRRFTVKLLKQSIFGALNNSAMVMFIVIGATCFASVFLGLGGGREVASLLLGLPFGKWGVFFVIVIIITILGMFLDWIGIVFMLFPILLPLLPKLGFDQLWFIIVTAVVLQTSFLSPPLGYALFFLKGISPEGITLGHIYRGVVPFIFLILLSLILFIVFPPIITWLPSLIAAG
ncbi:MAG: TRAP transporter large permease subunit [Deltaproteobacteria bacterium]|nr:TRAP transporter large permease subunit [Deltaproteobacteria bacterium]